MISLLFWCLAAVCCAVMDTLVHHFDNSIFFPDLKHSKRCYWWNPGLSWKNKYIDRDPEKGKIKWFWGLMDKPVFLNDGWHLFKSLMIVFICLSIVTFKPLFNWWIDFTLFGLVWNLIFNLFYNKILIKKK